MAKKKPERIYRLEDIDTQFVSLVTAGANRQTEFLVVKAQNCNVCGEPVKLGPDGYARCEKCGNLVRKRSDDPEPRVEPVEQQQEKDDAFDLSSYLELVKERVHMQRIETQLSKGTDSTSPEGEDADQGDSAAAEVEKEESPNLHEALKERDEEISSIKQELEKAREELKKQIAKANATDREFAALKSRYYTLKTSVAGTTTFPRIAKTSEGKPQEKKPLWTNDLAEHVEG